MATCRGMPRSTCLSRSPPYRLRRRRPATRRPERPARDLLPGLVTPVLLLSQATTCPGRTSRSRCPYLYRHRRRTPPAVSATVCALAPSPTPWQVARLHRPARTLASRLRDKPMPRGRCRRLRPEYRNTHTARRAQHCLAGPRKRASRRARPARRPRKCNRDGTSAVVPLLLLPPKRATSTFGRKPRTTRLERLVQLLAIRPGPGVPNGDVRAGLGGAAVLPARHPTGPRPSSPALTAADDHLGRNPLYRSFHYVYLDLL